MSTKKGAPLDVHTMPLDELQKRVAKGQALVAELVALFPGLVTMTKDDRIHTDGRMRPGEDQAFLAVFAAADAKPAYFTSFADKDDGLDPDKFETQLLRDRLERRNQLNALAVALEPVATQLGDTVDDVGEKVAPVTRAVYRVGKAISDTDPQLRTLLAPAIDFYAKKKTRGAGGGGPGGTGGGAGGNQP